MAPTTSLSLYMSIAPTSTIGSGDPIGFAGIHLTTGIIGLVGGIPTIAWHLIYIGTIVIGITIGIRFAPIVRGIIRMTTIIRCTTRFVVPTMRYVIRNARLLRAMPIVM